MQEHEPDREPRPLVQARTSPTSAAAKIIKKRDEDLYKEGPTSVQPPQNVDGVTPKQFTSLGNYIMQGMNESEAALLAGIPKLTIMVLRRKSDEYNDFVERKKLEFKQKHLKILASKSDPKISQWLLERLAPEEFSNKNKKDDVPTNVVAAIIRDIQKSDDNASALNFSYNEDINASHENSNTQRSSRHEATERIRSILS